MAIVTNPKNLKIGERARDIPRMLRDIEGLKSYPRVIITCEVTGWFLDGRILFRLTEDEKEVIAQARRRMKPKNDDKPFDLSEILPKTVGPSLKVKRIILRQRDEGFCERPPLLELLSFSKGSFLIEGWRYLTIMSRHPEASLFLDCHTPKPKQSHLIVFSEKGQIVGMVTPFLMMEEFTPIKNET